MKGVTMDKNVRELIGESIRLERNIGRLYARFSRDFHEDSEFWAQLAIEENNHASLLSTGNQVFLEVQLFPHDLLCSQIECLRKANKKVLDWSKKCRDSAPPRKSAFDFALKLETSVGELHYQQGMAGKAGSDAAEVFRKLNGEDKDHADRIKAYMREKGIK